MVCRLITTKSDALKLGLEDTQCLIPTPCKLIRGFAGNVPETMSIGRFEDYSSQTPRRLVIAISCREIPLSQLVSPVFQNRCRRKRSCLVGLDRIRNGLCGSQTLRGARKARRRWDQLIRCKKQDSIEYANPKVRWTRKEYMEAMEASCLIDTDCSNWR